MLIVVVLTVLKSKKVNICGPFPGCIFKVVDVYSRTFLSFVLIHFFRMFSLPNAVKKKKKKNYILRLHRLLAVVLLICFDFVR